MDNSTIEVVIRMTKEEYEYCCDKHAHLFRLEEYVADGKLLPKGHGRLIDADMVDSLVKNPYENAEVMRWVNRAPTIIEADKDGEE